MLGILVEYTVGSGGNEKVLNLKHSILNLNLDKLVTAGKVTRVNRVVFNADLQYALVSTICFLFLILTKFFH